MSRSVSMIGLSPDELPWIRRLLSLLRHPDPTVAELTREALLYLSSTPERNRSRHAPEPNPGPKSVMLNCGK